MPRRVFAHAAATAAALLSLAAIGSAHAGPQPTVVIQAGAPPYGVPVVVAPPHYRAPPPPRHEAVPRPRRGMVWEGGHWEWRGHRYAWVPGRWLQARPGYAYRQPHWQQRGDRWVMQRGAWDRDGDGVPDRHDRRPTDPRRY